jgi:hypothetical protein
MRGRVGLVLGDRNDAAHDVLESLRGARCCHLRAKAWVVLALEPVAVARQRPALRAASD